MDRLEPLLPGVGGGPRDPRDYALAFVARFRHDTLQLEREWPFLRAVLLRAWRDGDVGIVAQLAGGVAAVAGRLEVTEAESTLRLGIAACRQTSDRRRLAPLLNRLGGIVFAAGRCEEGSRLWRQGLELATSQGFDPSAGLWEPLSSFAFIADIAGISAGAWELIKLLARDLHGDDPDSPAVALFVHAFHASARNDLDRAYDDLRACLRLLALRAPSAAPAAARQLFTLAAQLELARVQGQYVQARDDAQRALALAHATGDGYTSAVMLIDQVRYSAALGHLADARATFARLCDSARHGSPQPAVVASASRVLAHRLYGASTLVAHATPDDDLRSTKVPVSRQVEPLSEREVEVLRLVAVGLGNRDIAAHLVVTTSTVKKHLEHVYAKLDAHSRTSALARARTLGLVP